MGYLGGEAATEGGGGEVEAAVGGGAVGPVEVPGVEVVEEERGAPPDPGDGGQPPRGWPITRARSTPASSPRCT